MVSTLKPAQNGCYVAGNIFKSILLNGNYNDLIKVVLKFVPKGLFDNVSPLVQVMTEYVSGHYLETMIFKMILLIEMSEF